jgi:uncharacterized protein
VAEQRYDLSRLQAPKVEKLPTGGVRVPARLTRVGVFDYRQPDGTVRRELRPAEEVFDAASLDSLADAPVIEGHPAMVDPANFKDLAKGHVSGTPRKDGIFVSAKAVVQDAATISRIDTGDLCEVSCGYQCDIEPTSGVFDGQPYDVVQRNIRYNHVGLGPKNWGRAGSDVALRFDGGVCEILTEQPKGKKVTKCRFDGREYERGSDDHVMALEAKLDGQLIEVKSAQARVDAAEGALAAEKAEHAKTKDSLAKASDQARIDGLVNARVELLVAATKVLGGDAKFDGKSDREIMAEVVAVAYPETKLDGKSDDYVRALFDRALEQDVRADSIERLPGLLVREQHEQDRQDAAAAARKPEPAPWAMSK